MTAQQLFTFERTVDYELVRQIVTHPRIYLHVVDDFSPPAEQYRPIEHIAVWYVLVRDGDELLGLWTFTPHNGVCWEVHTCLLPNAWGERGRRAAIEMQEWIWHNTICCRIITNVPEGNPLALKFAEAAGMTFYGVNEKSYLKNGRLESQTLLGVTRPGY